VEYTFIDFEYMIIGEKIKHKTHDDKISPLQEFDHFYLAKLMIANDNNLKFYDQSSVQKIIDMQYV